MYILLSAASISSPAGQQYPLYASVPSPFAARKDLNQSYGIKLDSSTHNS